MYTSLLSFFFVCIEGLLAAEAVEALTVLHRMLPLTED